MPRLRRSHPDGPGFTRRRSGKGFVYLDEQRSRIGDPAVIERIRGLVIPPAWQNVWISPHPNGHLQAVGTDDRGRRQYLYHTQWQQSRTRQKHNRVIGFAAGLPAARRQVSADLALPGMPRERVLATAFRLLDLGLFRIGGESYTQENGSYGLATLRKKHARVVNGTAVFEYPAKSGMHRELTLTDDGVVPVVAELARRRGGGEELLAWRENRRWVDVGSADINAYVKQVLRPDFSAKDFRTWHATLLAAVAFAEIATPTSATAAKRSVATAMKEVSQQLGNTPAVCRASYVNPRVIDLFQDGVTIRAAVRRARAMSQASTAEADALIEKALLCLLQKDAH